MGYICILFELGLSSDRNSFIVIDLLVLNSYNSSENNLGGVYELIHVNITHSSV